MVYKFERLSQAEVESMLGITLQQTRVYQEIKQEGREEGREEATVNLIIRLLIKRFGELSQEMRRQISTLPIDISEKSQYRSVTGFYSYNCQLQILPALNAKIRL